MSHSVAGKWNLTLEKYDGALCPFYYWFSYDETPNLVRRLVRGMPGYITVEEAEKDLDSLWIEVMTFVGGSGE